MRLKTAFMIVSLLVALPACQRESSPESAMVPEQAGSWEETGRDWRLRLIDDSGFGNPDNIGVGRIVAAGEWLYLGTWNGAEGAMMYRSRDGESWDQMGAGSVTGNRNDFVIVSIAAFGSWLYVGTWNQVDGAAMFRADASVADSSAIAWQQVTADGFGNPSNTGFTHMRVFKDHLYAGCFNYNEGSELWRSRTGDPGSWEMVIPKGWNTEGNTDTTYMLVHGGYLYVGTESARSKLVNGAQLWRTDGRLQSPWNQWEKVSIDGFGNPANHNICGLAELHGKIYAGTWNETQGLEVWRATPSESVPFDDWEQVNRNGFGHPDYTLTSSMVALGDRIFLSGFKWEGSAEETYILPDYPPGTPADSVFASSSDGLTWQLITRTGFMERPVVGIMWLEAFRGRVFAGLHSQGAPMQLWVYEPAE